MYQLYIAPLFCWDRFDPFFPLSSFFLTFFFKFILFYFILLQGHFTELFKQNLTSFSMHRNWSSFIITLIQDNLFFKLHWCTESLTFQIHVVFNKFAHTHLKTKAFFHIVLLTMHVKHFPKCLKNSLGLYMYFYPVLTDKASLASPGTIWNYFRRDNIKKID